MKLNESILKNLKEIKLKESDGESFVDTLPENIIADFMYLARFLDIYDSDGMDSINGSSRMQVLNYLEDEVGDLDSLYFDMSNFDPSELKDEVSSEEYKKLVKAHKDLLDTAKKMLK